MDVVRRQILEIVSGYQLFRETTTEVFENLERFWQIESYGTLPTWHKSNISLNDQKALTKLETSSVLKDGHLEIGLLWKNKNPELTYNRQAAMKHLQSLERKLERNPSMKKCKIRR